MPKGSDPEGWSAERRCALVVEILRGHVSIDDAAREHALSREQVQNWHDRFLAGAAKELEPGTSLNRWFNAGSIAILVVWLGLRVLYWNGYYIEDSPGYVTDAIFASQGQYHARDHVNGLNVGTYLPVAVPIALLGKSEIALSLWPAFCSLLGLVSIGGLATMLFGRQYGLLAAFLYATYPGDVFFSTVVMPDAIQAGWLSFSMYLIGRAASPLPRGNWILLAGGAAMGICHLIRGNDPILIPIGLSTVVLFSMLWTGGSFRTALRNCLTYVCGWMLIVLAEGLAYLWATGDFFHRFRVIARHYGPLGSHERWGLNADLTTIPFSIFSPWAWWRHGGWGSFVPDQAYHALTFVAALVAVALGLIAIVVSRRSLPAGAWAGFAAGMVWFTWPLFYHQFGSQSLTQFVPIHRLSRHLVVYAPGAIFMTVAGCFVIGLAAARWGVSRRLAAAAILPLLIVYMGAGLKGVSVAHENFHGIKRTYIRISRHLPPDTNAIVADPGDLGIFDFWLNPPGGGKVRMVPLRTTWIARSSRVASC
jgi:hypothetical protein